jgi:nucleotide-binding universal stress UspA family protein
MPHVPKTVLVGVDYSDLCIPALDEALRIVAPSAGHLPQGVLIPLLVLPDEPATYLDAIEGQQRVARAKVNLVRLVNSRASRLSLAMPRVVPCVRLGAPADRILNEARTRAVDLVAVGTHARRGLSELLLGSVAREVVRRSPCTVLVARRTEPLSVFDVDQHLPLDIGSVEGTHDEIDDEDADMEEVDEEPPSAQALGEAHLEAGQVVLHVLDRATGQTFVCWFSDPATIRIEPLEREWVPQPSPAARARAIRAALDEVQRDPQRFATLFAELRPG